MISILHFAAIIVYPLHTFMFDAMMMKKLLISTLILTGLTLTACVKKEAPKEEEQVEVTPASEISTPEPTQFEPLEPVEPAAIEEEVAPTVEIQREQTENTTTEIRREIKKPETTEPAPVPETREEPASKPADNTVLPPKLGGSDSITVIPPNFSKLRV